MTGEIPYFGLGNDLAVSIALADGETPLEHSFKKKKPDFIKQAAFWTLVDALFTTDYKKRPSAQELLKFDFLK